MLEIKRLEIPEVEGNQVKSSRVFKKGKILDKDGKFRFYEEGIFSKKIFGNFNKCDCGKLNYPGICNKCQTRVLDKANMPVFYISFDNFEFPDLVTDYPNGIKFLLEYKAFLYEGEIISFDTKTIHEYDESKVILGKEAAEILGYSPQLNNKLVIPHTSMRKIQSSGEDYILGTLNLLYIDLLKQKEKLETFEINSTFLELAIKNKLFALIETIRNELISILTSGKKSTVAKELRGQKVVGNIRAVVINNYGIDEDDILIGDYFIPSLYPKYSEQFKTENGYDIPAFNQFLKENNYKVLVNRQPSIGAKSIIACRPIFTESDREKYIVQVNPIITSGLALDMDGDVLSIIALYSKEANDEAELMLTSNNYLEGANGTIMQAYPEDFEYVKTRLESKS